MSERGADEEAYAALADELNDGCSTSHPVDSTGACRLCLTLDDFEPTSVAAAERYAEANGLSWPPSVGDFDRYYDWRNNEGRDR